MIITRTPFRVSFFGGGSDYRPWFQENGGFIISSAINKYCYISIRRLQPFFGYNTRVVYSRMETVHKNGDIEHPSVKHCLRFMGVEEGLEIHHDGDLPARSGIGSSSTFTVGFLNALHALRFELAGPRRLADEAIHVEQDLIRENVGIQDQIAAAFGGLNLIEMGPGPDYRVSPLILPPDYARAFESHVLLGFTGVHRFASGLAGKQIENIESGKAGANLREITDIAREALSLFKRRADFSELGRLMDISWKHKRQVATSVSSDDIDAAYAEAMRRGAYGGKILGAGGGGFIMFFAPPERHAAIREAIPGIRVWVPYGIDRGGSRVIFIEEDRG